MTGDAHIASKAGTRPQPAPWDVRTRMVVEAMREMSVLSDPQEMVRAYAKRARDLLPNDRLVSLSRRGLDAPWYRITRSSLWREDINPWEQTDRLPLYDRGFLGELIYADEPLIIDDIKVPDDDPAREQFEGMRSLVAIPNYDHGQALNCVVLMRRGKAAFDRETLPEVVWLSNLFGRATQNLVLSQELDKAYREVDRELKSVADIQRSLLPAVLPNLETLDLAAHYATSRRAGGDYYDALPIENGRLGVLMVDVCGHGTPAAVLMAVTHSLAHAHRAHADDPAAFLAGINDALVDRYTRDSGAFVTAFYGVYDPRDRSIAYASAGHPPPLVKRCTDGRSFMLDEASTLPLGITRDHELRIARASLVPGDQLVIYTDGVTEAFNKDRTMYGVHRLRAAIEDCSGSASALIAAILDDVERFSEGAPADDDRTLLVAKVR